MNTIDIIRRRVMGSSTDRLRDIARGIVPMIDSVVEENDTLHARCQELETRNAQLTALCQQTEMYRKQEKERADNATQDLAMARAQMQPLIAAVSNFSASTEGAKELAERFSPTPAIQHQSENQEAA